MKIFDEYIQKFLNMSTKTYFIQIDSLIPILFSWIRKSIFLESELRLSLILSKIFPSIYQVFLPYYSYLSQSSLIITLF